VSAYVKDPAANLPFSENWATWLAGEGSDTISTSTWVATPTGLTIGATSHDTTSATVWISGGTVDVTYTLTNHIVTVGGRIDERSSTIRVIDR